VIDYVQPEPFVDPETAGKFLGGFSGSYMRKLAASGAIKAHNYGVGKRKFWRFKLSELAAPPAASIQQPRDPKL
jgi:hypothetical protein